MKDTAISAGTKLAYAHSRRDERGFQDSIGYALATEGARSNTMGVAGGLQLWPRSYQDDKAQHQHTHPYQEIHSVPRTHAHPYQESVDSDRTAFGRAHSGSVSSHDMNNKPRRRPILHAASQPDLHSSLRYYQTDKNAPPVPSVPSMLPPVPQRKQFHKLFSRHKPKQKDHAHAHAQPYPPQPLDLPPPPPPPIPFDARSRQNSETSTRPASSSASQRTHATVFDRNPTENAKINVRRPPKGIKHWFEGLDESDDDLPEVYTPAEPVSAAPFRPSLGPARSRVAPTSRVSPAGEPTSADYFEFHNSRQLQERSMLNLSSDDDDDDDDDDPSEPPSPWTHESDHTGPQVSFSLTRQKTNDTRQSTFSMQTTMTSGSIPIINGDSLGVPYRTPLPPLPTQYQSFNHATAAPAHHQSPSHSAASSLYHSSSHASAALSPYQPFSHDAAIPAPLRHRKSNPAPPVTRARAKSSVSTAASDTSTNGQSHVMSVTQEEMALLEMMRRKRAEMQGQGQGQAQAQVQVQAQYTHSARRPEHHQPRHISPFERHNSIAKSVASSTLSRNSGRSLGLVLDSPAGTAFPAPPSARVIQETENMNYFQIAFDDKPSAASTPHSSTLAELEAPTEQLSALCFSKPSKSRSQDRFTPSYEAADPFQLAPNLELSSLDLLPLPARTYSPSLAGTCSSAMTPEFNNQAVTGFDVTESDDESDHGDRHRDSVKTMDSVDLDPYTAWGRLGGL